MLISSAASGQRGVGRAVNRTHSRFVRPGGNCIGKRRWLYCPSFREPKYFLTPITLYRPQGPLTPKSAGPRLRSREPKR
jgi:hypothetical protein